jgi:hypothetical protein
MTRGIVIAGNESALLNAIEVEAVKRTKKYALAAIPDRFSGENTKLNIRIREEDSSSSSSAGQPSPEKPRVPLEWNPGSPISAHTMVLAAKNHLEHISEAILVCNPPSVRCAAADLNFLDIEVLVNDHVKSWFFLVKELAIMFRTQGKGTLALVYPENAGTGGKDDAADLLGPTALAAFRSFVRGLLVAAPNEPYFTLGFSGAEAGDEAGFAAFIFKQLDEENRRSNGKLYKYGKLSFFR